VIFWEGLLGNYDLLGFKMSKIQKKSRDNRTFFKRCKVEENVYRQGSREAWEKDKNVLVSP
jgi:hypothetical protein